MLMAPLDDTARSMLLFPTWPSDRWNVRFKMHAPLNTTIEASCQDGQLEYLVVTPPQRKADITVVNCQHKSDDGEVGTVCPGSAHRTVHCACLRLL